MRLIDLKNTLEEIQKFHGEDYNPIITIEEEGESPDKEILGGQLILHKDYISENSEVFSDKCFSLFTKI